jgi:thioredoxin 1
MKNAFIFISLIFCLESCTTAQQSNTITPTAFHQLLTEAASAQLVDVRTPEEFREKSLSNSINIDYNNEDFLNHIALLDKDKPTFVYCLSGGRSSAALNILSEKGFKEVYELKGGIMSWERENLPIEKHSAPKEEVSQMDLNNLINQEKAVLIDFNAKWCAPCRKMAPFLKTIAKEKADLMEFLPIDADNHPALLQTYEVESLPKLILYKNQQIVWKHSGFIKEEDLRDILKKYDL